MIIAVDFDGTVVDHRFPEIGPEAPGAVKWLRRWTELGAKLILWTMRSDSKSQGPVFTGAVKWFQNNSIELWGLNSNPEQSTWSESPKAYAKLYVDDAAFGCPLVEVVGFTRLCVDWEIVGPAIEKLLLVEKA